MGRATHSKDAQISYMKNRIQLISYMVQAFEAGSTQPEDLDQLLHMMDEFEIRIRRFRDDWKEDLSRFNGQ
ncbi:SE1561 family protein [Sporolactobacillus sp. Y61]|uniref:SE1561 family protein n=1 Tax=Sporolactobacillus sp. Y61 TaxID=3160863 RepID=A0AAU8IF28_9BACL|nr:SE1561 family protein [Sporolactobacillus sp. THM19-2]RYL88906.1 hypothetical protein EWH91_11280 [Sporolactobacillus sp. THM19-2]